MLFAEHIILQIKHYPIQHNEMDLQNSLVDQRFISILEFKLQLLSVGIYKGHIRIYSFLEEKNTAQIGKDRENALITELSSKQSTKLTNPAKHTASYIALQKKKNRFQKTGVI